MLSKIILGFCSWVLSVEGSSMAVVRSKILEVSRLKLTGDTFFNFRERYSRNFWMSASCPVSDGGLVSASAFCNNTWMACRARVCSSRLDGETARSCCASRSISGVVERDLVDGRLSNPNLLLRMMECAEIPDWPLSSSEGCMGEVEGRLAGPAGGVNVWLGWVGSCAMWPARKAQVVMTISSRVVLSLCGAPLLFSLFSILPKSVRRLSKNFLV